MSLKKILEDELDDLIKLAVTELPDDVEQALKNALKNEKTEIGKMNLRIILENLEIAKTKSLPICQDTGILNFFIKIGKCSISYGEICEIIKNAVKRSTKNIPIRPSVVDPLSRKNTNNNVGEKIPHLCVDFNSEPYFEITVFPKGAGSENMCRMFMLTPHEGLLGIKKSVLETVIESGGKPCPPIKIGIGIGGSSDLAMKLSKDALLRPLGKNHPVQRIASIENELLKMINDTELGPMGLGGIVTALGVNIEYASCHTASLPLGIGMQCWADRRATMRVYESGKIEYLSHRRAGH